MGIPFYFSHIIKNHREILYKLNNKQNNQIEQNNIIIDNLYLDSNSIIYDILYKQTDLYDSSIEYNNRLIQLVRDKIEEYVELINPTKTIFIAFDGVAPLAKMHQQRSF